MTGDSKLLKNIGSNLVGGAINGFLLVIITPVYFSHLGSNGFGVYGLWLLLQLLSSLFDAGFGATLVREFASFKSLKREATDEKTSFLFTYECLYLFLGAVLACLVWLLSGYIATSWLIFKEEVDVIDVRLAVETMGPALGLFFVNSMYVNVMTGMQIHIKMNLIQIVFNVLRQVGGVFILQYCLGLKNVFIFQSLVYVSQIFVLRYVVWSVVQKEGRQKKHFSFSCLKKSAKFTSGMALTTALSLLVASADRLVVSKLVPVEDFGNYTLAFSATGLLQFLFIAFYKSYFPKFSEISSANNKELLEKTYAIGSIRLGIILVPLSLTAFLFAPQLFHAWVGTVPVDVVAVFRVALVGVSCSGLMWIPIACQQACGVNRIHTNFLVAALIIGLPLCYVAVKYFGVVGAAVFWLFHGLSELFIGLRIAHRKLGLFNVKSWYLYVICKPLLVSIPVCFLAHLTLRNHIGGIVDVLVLAIFLFVQILILAHFLKKKIFI